MQLLMVLSIPSFLAFLVLGIARLVIIQFGKQKREDDPTVLSSDDIGMLTAFDRAAHSMGSQAMSLDVQ